MTASHGLSSINCTSCGAGLSVLGGGRVLSHVCGYCGAVLDTQDNYKVLDSIGKRNHPSSPVQIGMTLKHEGVDFTVIGTLGIVEKYGGQTWRWVEHQVFSPTHGYMWLNVENGNLTFTRKVRDYNMGHWLSPSTVERAESPPRRNYGGENYRYYETSNTQIDFMEGEFNWVPKLGEKKSVVSLLGPSAMLGLVKSETEREVELTKLLPRGETAREMGFDPGGLGPEQRHPLMPYRPLQAEKFLRRSLFWTAMLSFFVGLFMLIVSGPNVLDAPAVRVADLPESYEFEINDRSQLVRVRFDTNLQNAWTVVSAEILGPDGNPVVAAARAISFYSGRSGGESWSEGSRNAQFRFRPDATGTHRLRLELADAGNAPEDATVAVVVTEGRTAPFWMNLLGILCLIGWIAIMARKAIHSSRRFAGSDWTNED